MALDLLSRRVIGWAHTIPKRIGTECAIDDGLGGGSMSRRGNCHDNAVAESFFQLLKGERIRQHLHTTREDARSHIFDYIEMLYNTRRRHGFNNQLSPVEYEARYQQRLISA